MITIISCPKSFEDNINIIQRNAIKSWINLNPKPEVILVGDDGGVSEICKEFGLKHFPNVEKNNHGTPLISSIFDIAQREAEYPLICFVNTDIILLKDFIKKTHEVFNLKDKMLLVGRRWDLDVNEEIDYSGYWDKELRAQIKKTGKLHEHTGMDYMVFPKGLYEKLPPFAVGRRFWDNWFIYYTISNNIPVVEMTKEIDIIHQNHGYSHYKRKKAFWEEEETKEHIKLAGGFMHLYSMQDATFIYSNNKFKKNYFAYLNVFLRILKKFYNNVIKRNDRW